MVKRLRPFTRANRAQRVAKIETAVALSGNLKARLHDDLVRIYGPALRISFVQSPVLMGGMRITVGSDLYDGSVRGTLAALEGTFRD
jgi:F-type H+-transporting ATPase subunit delta